MKKLLAIVSLWFLGLVLLAVVASRSPFIPSFPYYQSDLSGYPQWVRVFAHFDGIHYLRIASYGYLDVGTQAFFPLYPLLIRLLSPLFPFPLYAGVLLSLASLLAALIGLKKLFPKSWSPIYLLLLFPVSFFFAGVYTESLFLALTVWFFYFLKMKRWWLAATLAALASTTRPIGVFLAPALTLELLRHKKYFFLPVLSLISVSGLLAYMYYLYSRFGDPLLFFHVQPLFGAERSGQELVWLPQVIYRYLKMIITVVPSSFLYQRLWLELLTFLGAASLALRNLRRAPLSQSLFIITSLLLPTLTGTLSSMPRYVLVLLPWLLPQDLKISWKTVLLTGISFSLLIYFFTLFATGTFVS